MEFESSGTQEHVMGVVISYLQAMCNVTDEQLSVVVSAGSSQRVLLRSSSSWQADFEIAANELAAEQYFQVTLNMSVGVARAEAAMKASFW